MVSKRHVDTLVQSALAGPSDGRGWNHGEPFSWYHDERRHSVDPFAQGDEDSILTGVSMVEQVSPSRLGQRLVDECVASVHGRYPDTNPDEGDLPGPHDAYYMGPYVFEPVTRPGVMLIGARGLTIAIEPLVSAAELATGIAYYEYQSCETPDWKQSEAFAICRAMKDRILCTLRGAAEAPWGWD